MPNRNEVYAVIDRERDYQNDLKSDRTDGSDKSVGEYLVMLDTYINLAKTGWTMQAGNKAALDCIRKIAAVAVRCMEEHGVVER